MLRLRLHRLAFSLAVDLHHATHRLMLAAERRFVRETHRAALPRIVEEFRKHTERPWGSAAGEVPDGGVGPFDDAWMADVFAEAE